MFGLIITLMASLLLVFAAEDAKVEKATVLVQSVEGQSVTGAVTFEHTEDGVKISGSFSGLPEGLHGVAIHSIGDISAGDCSKVGYHFNPHGRTHGDRTSSSSKRHVGDLGNVKAGSDGIAEISFTDDVISLKQGKDNIIGKALVVHEREDDHGKGTGADAEESKKTGNVGKPLACGVIGVGQDRSGSSVAFPAKFSLFAALAAALFELI